MSPITTHVLDTSRGQPAAGVPITLSMLPEGDGAARAMGSGITDADGRLRVLLPDGDLDPGVYRLTFDTCHYFRALGVANFYPEVAVTFQVRAAGEHYHVPLLLSPFGYSTYRGS